MLTKYMDSFHFKKKYYSIIVIDYYSKYIVHGSVKKWFWQRKCNLTVYVLKNEIDSVFSYPIKYP